MNSLMARYAGEDFAAAMKLSFEEEEVKAYTRAELAYQGRLALLDGPYVRIRLPSDDLEDKDEKEMSEEERRRRDPSYYILD